MAGLVAAQTVTALEIKETGLVQTQEAAHTMLAQIEDGDSVDKAPSNGNTSGASSTESAINSEEEDETIDLMTTANLAGLDAKRDFIIQKV